MPDEILKAPERMDEGMAIRPLAALHESEENPREITDERFEALKYALAADPDMLTARPIIATPSGEVVCGNMRLRALSEMGWTEAPVFVKDLSPAKRREWMLRDNQEYGDWVPEELAALVKAHQDEAGDLKLLGFSEPRVDGLLKLASEEPGANGGGGSDDAVAPEVWGLIVECESEEQQADLIERLSDEGLSCRAILP